jgi:hypothetical protein
MARQNKLECLSVKKEKKSFQDMGTCAQCYTTFFYIAKKLEDLFLAKKDFIILLLTGKIS